MTSTRMFVIVTISVFVLMGTLAPSTSFKLQIYPYHQKRALSDRVMVKCIADEPITSCEFRSFYKYHYDLNAGQLTRPTETFRYFGNGLENGECGIDLAPYRRMSHDIIECKIRTQNHGWKYASAMVEINDEPPKPKYFVSPPHAYVFPGANITALGHSELNLASCSYKWTASSWIHFNQSSHLELPEEDRNLGRGLENGDCAVTLSDVQSSGFVIFLAFRENEPRETTMCHMTVMVYKAPSPTELTLDSPDSTYEEGGTLHATCVVSNARPVANISWTFGGDLLRNDTLDETADTRLRWKWSYDTHTITQRITRTLTWEDDGKELVCRAGHLALPDGYVDVEKNITVLYSPRPVGRGLELSNLKVGETATAVVRYYSNPAPKVGWWFDNINPGSAVHAGRYNITQPQKVPGLGNVWVSTLTIYNLTYKDKGQGVFVTAQNSVGGVIQQSGFLIHFYDYEDLFDEYSYGSAEMFKAHREPEILMSNYTTTASTPVSTTGTTPMTAATTTVAATTMTSMRMTTETITSTTPTTMMTTSVTTEAVMNTTEEEVVEAVNATMEVEQKESSSHSGESAGTASKVGLAFGIISLLIVISVISFFVYKYTSRRCLNQLPYAHFRRSAMNDGEDETFNVHADLEVKV